MLKEEVLHSMLYLLCVELDNLVVTDITSTDVFGIQALGLMRFGA